MEMLGAGPRLTPHIMRKAPPGPGGAFLMQGVLPGLSPRRPAQYQPVDCEWPHAPHGEP